MARAPLCMMQDGFTGETAGIPAKRLCSFAQRAAYVTYKQDSRLYASVSRDFEVADSNLGYKEVQKSRLFLVAAQARASCCVSSHSFLPSLLMGAERSLLGLAMTTLSTESQSLIGEEDIY